MNNFCRNKLIEIKEIIKECEEIQDSEESGYTKEQAKLSAYNSIKELLDY